MAPARHAQQAAKLKELGISHRSAARDLKFPASSFSNYMLYGRLPQRTDRVEFSERVDTYLRVKRAASKSAQRIVSAPMYGKLCRLGVKLNFLSDDTGLPRDLLLKGLRQGIWPDERTRDFIAAWIDKRSNEQEGKKMITKITLPEEVVGHYGLKRDPFSNEMEGEEDIADLKQLKEAEKKILNAVDKNGWVAITGDVGSGKSTLLKRVEARLQKKKENAIVKPRIIEKQFLGASHVCDSILHDLGTVGGKSGTLEHKARLVGQTLEEAYRGGRKVIVMIDEGHLLRPEALLALKRIYEFELGFKKLLTIILVGQVGLARQLKGNFELREVSQRVDLYELGGLNGQIGAYLAHKLERAGLNGGGSEVFEKSALKAFGERNADTPLSVNNLAAAALIAAWDLGEKKVSGEIVRSIQGSF